MAILSTFGTKIDLPFLEKFKTHLVQTYNSTYRRNKNDMLNESSVCDKEFYKVKFTEALDLVRSRKVFIYEGQCYVPIGNVQLFFSSLQFCTLDGVLIIAK